MEGRHPRADLAPRDVVSDAMFQRMHSPSDPLTHLWLDARAIGELAQFRPRLRHEAEGDMIRLSLAIARRILRREMSVDPGAMHGLVLGALEKLQSQEITRVRVHPSQVAPVDACLREAVPGTRVEVIGDPAREAGSMVFETTHGNLDASIDCQLQEIERGLTDRLDRQK